MRGFFRIIAWLTFLFLLVVVAAMFAIRGSGFSARAEPSSIETRLALFMRGWLTPSTYKGLPNPVSDTTENFLAAREHFADHCATCHANDGSGNSAIGRNFYPKPPDMRLPRTQGLSDGELFYIIENGVMLTGMPGFGTGTPEGEKSSWQLVHFVRRLPSLTPEDLQEMQKLNPVSGVQLEEERKIKEFLEGGTIPANTSPADPHTGHKPPPR
jgi:mono/diheme cytochrome c family protein